MKLNKTNTNKSVVELRSELNKDGIKVENVYVDNVKFTTIGYCSEKDKNACLKAIQLAVDSSDNIWEAAMKLMTNANLTDNGVEPNEEVKINGTNYFISYAEKALYDPNGDEVVNCKELECELPPEACKTILVQRAELIIAGFNDLEGDEDCCSVFR
jgi:hypothetical protein